MKKIFTILVLLLSLYSIVEAAPAVSTYSGTIINGNTIIISGAGFGANGPYVVIFDDFERGTNGNQLSTNLATLGAWSGGDEWTHTLYQNTWKVSGNLAAQFDATYSGSGQPELWVVAPVYFDSFFIAWWQMVPSGDNYSGQGAGGINWKQMWILTDNCCGEADQVLTDTDGGGNSLTSNSSPFRNNLTLHYTDSPRVPGEVDFPGWVRGTWMRWAIWERGRTDSTGHITVRTTSTLHNTQTNLNRDTQTINSGMTGLRHRLAMNGYTRPRTKAPCRQLFDDVYFAVGEHAQARVELGNANTYAGSSNLTMCTTGLGVQGWSDTSITCTVRQGGFANGSKAWIYVTDENGKCSKGYPVTIGGAKN